MRLLKLAAPAVHSLFSWKQEELDSPASPAPPEEGSKSAADGAKSPLVTPKLGKSPPNHREELTAASRAPGHFQDFAEVAILINRLTRSETAVHCH